MKTLAEDILQLCFEEVKTGDRVKYTSYALQKERDAYLNQGEPKKKALFKDAHDKKAARRGTVTSQDANGHTVKWDDGGVGSVLPYMIEPEKNERLYRMREPSGALGPIRDDEKEQEMKDKKDDDKRNLLKTPLKHLSKHVTRSGAGRATASGVLNLAGKSSQGATHGGRK